MKQRKRKGEEPCDYTSYKCVSTRGCGINAANASRKRGAREALTFRNNGYIMSTLPNVPYSAQERLASCTLCEYPVFILFSTALHPDRADSC